MANDLRDDPMLEYEPPSDNGSLGNGAWRLLCVGLMLFAIFVLSRHAGYWLGQLWSRRRSLFGDNAPLGVREFGSFLAELVLLGPILVIAARGRRGRLNLLAILCALYIVLVLGNAIIDAWALRGSAPFAVATLLRQEWIVATRAQSLVMPLLCVVAALRQADRSHA